MTNTVIVGVTVEPGSKPSYLTDLPRGPQPPDTWPETAASRVKKLGALSLDNAPHAKAVLLELAEHLDTTHLDALGLTTAFPFLAHDH